MNEESKLKLKLMKRLEHQDIQSLTLLYQPLIGKEASSLYFTLVELAQNKVAIRNHKLILKLQDMSIHRFIELREVLEQYLLVKSYHSIEQQDYIYEIYAPYEAMKFLSHPIFGRLYLKLLGEQVYDYMKMSLVEEPKKYQGYYDMSKPIRNVLKTWNEEEEQDFHLLKPSHFGYEHLEAEINFDFAAFMDDISEFVLPTPFRTEKVLKEIGTLASLYGIPAEEMRKIVGKCTDFYKPSIDFEKMKNMVLQRFKELPIEKVDNPYLLTPVKFLQLKQNNIPVSASDKRIIDTLLSKFKLRPDVVNVLIEYVLQETNQRFTKSYVEKIATTWVRLKVDSIERAKAVIADTKTMYQTSGGTKVQEPLPAWYANEGTQDEKEVDEDKLNEIMERVLRGGEKT